MSFLLAILCCGPVESVWTIDRPLLAIVGQLKDRLDDPGQQLPADLIDLLDAADVTARMFAKPGQHYYRFEFEFAARRLSGTKSLEVWGLGDETRVRSRVSMSWGRNGPIIRWIMSRVEVRLLEFERHTLEGLLVP